MWLGQYCWRRSPVCASWCHPPQRCSMNRSWIIPVLFSIVLAPLYVSLENIVLCFASFWTLWKWDKLCILLWFALLNRVFLELYHYAFLLLYITPIIWIYHSSYICSTLDGHMGHFHLLQNIMHNAIRMISSGTHLEEFQSTAYLRSESVCLMQGGKWRRLFSLARVTVGHSERWRGQCFSTCKPFPALSGDTLLKLVIRVSRISCRRVCACAAFLVNTRLFLKGLYNLFSLPIIWGIGR